METVGLIGAGRMGRAMVKHLKAAGYQVVATDVAPEAREAARELGAETAQSAGEVAARCSIVFIAVGFDEEVAAVCRGADGIFARAGRSSVVVVNATVAPDLVQALGREAAQAGLDLLDVPIARGAWAADSGTLLALAGGEERVLERVRPMLSTFCSDIAHLGALGHGQVAKAVNNLLLWVDGVALLEAGRLAASTGIDLPNLRDALLMSSGRSFALEEWDNVTFTWALKDMQVVLDMCDKAGRSFPLLGMIKEQVKDAKAAKKAGEIGWTRK